MKAVTFVFLLAVCSVVTRAQNSAAPSGDLTIRMSEDMPEYCLGDISSPRFEVPTRGTLRGPDDITLQLPLKVSYWNQRSETIIVPLWTRYLTQMTVVGQDGSTVLKNVRAGGMDVNNVMAMSSPDIRRFLIIAGGSYAWSSGLEGVAIPVLDHSTGLDLRGKMVHIAMTRDFRSLPPGVVGMLNVKWKDYGTVWTGVAESNTVTVDIPKEPLTRSCITLVAR